MPGGAIVIPNFNPSRYRKTTQPARSTAKFITRFYRSGSNPVVSSHSHRHRFLRAGPSREWLLSAQKRPDVWE